MALYQPTQQPQLYCGDLFGSGCNSLFIVVPYVPPSDQVVSKVSKAMSRPPDPAKPSNSRPLHFVNTDAGSLGSRDAGRRTRDVKSHLSGHYRRWKKQQALAAQKAKAQQQQRLGEIASSSSAADLGAGASSSAGAGDSATESASLAPPTISSSDSDSHSEITVSPAESTRQISPWRDVAATTLRNALSHGNSDPFDALPLPVDPTTNMHIQLFHEGTTVMCWTTAVDQRLQDLMQHEALMHGVLATSKLITATYLAGARSVPALLPESRLHYGQLLRLMRSYLVKRTSFNNDMAIEMMHAAMMFSFLAREYAEFELHFKTLKLFIDSLGGINAISKVHSSRFLNAERLRGLFLLKKPLIPVKDWAPGSWAEQESFRQYDQMHEKSKSMVASSELPRLPTGPFLGQSLTLLSDHRDMLAAGGVAAMLFRGKKPGVELITNWLGFRSHSLAVRTAETVSDITRLKQFEPSIETSLHACACLASNFVAHLIHFSMNPTVGLSYIPFPILIENLQEVAEHMQRGALLQHPHLYVWALFVGACAELASRTWSCHPTDRYSTWCSTNLAYMIEKLGIDTIQDFKEVLRQFIFPFMFDSYLRVLFDKRHDLIKLSIDDQSSKE